MSSRTESRCEPAKNRFISRLGGIAASLRAANRDRRLLFALDDRMLADIGLARDDVVYGMRDEAAQSATSRTTGWRISVGTILIVLVSLVVALFAPDGSKVDAVRVTSCALFQQGIVTASNKRIFKCPVRYEGCRRIAGVPKHVC